jgi:antitoxin MazE
VIGGAGGSNGNKGGKFCVNHLIKVYTLYKLMMEVLSMNAVIQRWGDSHGIRIPKSVLEDAMFCPDEEVDIVAEENKIVILKKTTRRGHITLEERLKGFEGEYVFEECDWGEVCAR